MVMTKVKRRRPSFLLLARSKTLSLIPRKMKSPKKRKKKTMMTLIQRRLTKRWRFRMPKSGMMMKTLLDLLNVVLRVSLRMTSLKRKASRQT